MGDSAAFELLSPGVQRWIYRQGWKGLRPVQEDAIPLILSQDRDLLITAPTAGGKTEAAFLPLVSMIEENGPSGSYAVLCLSPLKALINDQTERLEPLCEQAQTRITPWHGDVSQSVKKRSWKSPTGILLITPESLEGMFLYRAGALQQALSSLSAVVIDEFHAFIGRERGQQLISLLVRLEALIGRTVPRIALSATIGDAEMACTALRPAGAFPSMHLASQGEGLDLQLALKALVCEPPTTFAQTASSTLFDRLRGDNHLVFANSRRLVEAVTVALSDTAKEAVLPNEFFAHHGSLAKEARFTIEQRLKEGRWPTTAIATSTLELGIDIGNVRSVAQIGAPANVSSLRQRLGRSGRRGHPARLRVLAESTGHVESATPIDRAELALVQSIAVIDLLLEGFLEPPQTHHWQLSTLVQQVLSMIAHRGDVTAATAYQTLCKQGPWRHLSSALFARVLRNMGSADLVQQLHSGELVVGLAGEKLTSHYTFLTAFVTPEEYRLIANGKPIGTLPTTTPYSTGQLIIFAGRRWIIMLVDERTKTLELKPSKSGDVPIFDGEAAPVHARIRAQMRSVLASKNSPGYCDPVALQALSDARRYFETVQIAAKHLVQQGPSTYWFVWESDAVISTYIAVLNDLGYEAGAVGNVVVIEGAGRGSAILEKLRDALAASDNEQLAQQVTPKPQGKYDEHLSDELLQDAFVNDLLDLDQALAHIETLVS
jgi:ATP-dependent Lhr-like helicase